jgi:hypothetical protein
MKSRIEIKIKAVERAIKVAHKEMNRRLCGMNEFRHQLDRQASEFITRKELVTLLIAEIALISLVLTVIFKFLK